MCVWERAGSFVICRAAEAGAKASCICHPCFLDRFGGAPHRQHIRPPTHSPRSSLASFFGWLPLHCPHPLKLFTSHCPNSSFDASSRGLSERRCRRDGALRNLPQCGHVQVRCHFSAVWMLWWEQLHADTERRQESDLAINIRKATSIGMSPSTATPLRELVPTTDTADRRDSTKAYVFAQTSASAIRLRP
jgi:hypothetical protein